MISCFIRLRHGHGLVLHIRSQRKKNRITGCLKAVFDKHIHANIGSIGRFVMESKPTVACTCM